MCRSNKNGKGVLHNVPHTKFTMVFFALVSRLLRRGAVSLLHHTAVWQCDYFRRFLSFLLRAALRNPVITFKIWEVQNSGFKKLSFIRVSREHADSWRQRDYFGFEVLTAMAMKSTRLWVVRTFSSEKSWRFGGTNRLDLQGWRIIRTRNHQKQGAS
jgi:hypothetical protein